MLKAVQLQKTSKNPARFQRNVRRRGHMIHSRLVVFTRLITQCARIIDHHQPFANLAIYAIILCTCAIGIGRPCTDPHLESFQSLLPHPSRTVTAQPTLQPTPISKPTILPYSYHV